MKNIICRSHGGQFSVPPKAGRPPVRCGGNYPACDRADLDSGEAERAVQANGAAAVRPVGGTRTQKPFNAPKVVHEPRSMPNPSLAPAKAAKDQLEDVGWVVQGKAWNRQGSDGDEEFGAEITASRGGETLIMLWIDGRIIDQKYSMSYTKPQDNGIPGKKLNFNADELTDRELVQRISGMKVTWWNTLASSTETAIIGGKISVEHIFVGNGDTDNSKRIVKFLDHSGGGFRAFHVSSLMKVG